MNSYNGLDIFSLGSSQVSRQTLNLQPPPQTVCRPCRYLFNIYHETTLFMALETAENKDPSLDPHSVPAPRHLALARFMAVVVVVAAWSWQSGSWQPYSDWGPPQVPNPPPLLLLRPTDLCYNSVIHCLHLQGATDRLSEFHPYFLILQRIDKLVYRKTILQLRHCLRLGLADKSSGQTALWLHFQFWRFGEDFDLISHCYRQCVKIWLGVD